MARLVTTLVLIFIFSLWGGTAAAVTTEKRDIVLLLENSQSMQENDPEFLLRKSALNFIEGLSGDTQIAIILFDGGTSVAMPLVPVSQKTRDALSANLDKLTYAGRFRNSAAGMERALYELKTYGRPEAEKAIVLMSDGHIDTGDEKRDRDFSRWMQEYLTNEATEAGIKVFGIAFTEAADFHLIHILTHATGGTYYRAPGAADLQAALNRIRKAITATSTATATPSIDIPEDDTPFFQARPPAEPPMAEPLAGESTAPALTAEKQLPSREDAEEQEHALPSPGESSRLQAYAARLKDNWEWIAATAGLFLIVFLIMAIFIRRSQRRVQAVIPAPPPDSDPRKYIPPAQLEGLTRPSHYDITGKLTWISRAPGENSKDKATICIQDDVISRDHALIQYRDYAYWISDRGSINGTFVNDEKITGERTLQNGDRIRFAKYEFRFTMPHRADMADTVLVRSDHYDDRTELIGLDEESPARPATLQPTSPPLEDEGEATIIRPTEANATQHVKQR